MPLLTTLSVYRTNNNITCCHCTSRPFSFGTVRKRGAGGGIAVNFEVVAATKKKHAQMKIKLHTGSSAAEGIGWRDVSMITHSQTVDTKDRDLTRLGSDAG